MLKLSFLGRHQVAPSGQTPLPFPTNKVRALLAYLALEADRAHQRAALVALLWPKMPEPKARNNLSKALGLLRQALQDRVQAKSYLLITSRIVRFNQHSAFWLDVAEFQRNVIPQAGVPQLELAVKLYRGELLSGFALPDAPEFEAWLLLWRERLHQQMLAALERLADHFLEVENAEPAQKYARRQLDLEPWHEAGHVQMMRALFLAGDRSGALAQYERCRQQLADELGVEPDAATTRLYEQIRDGENRGEGRRAVRHNLPMPLSPFIGREREVAQLVQWLQDPARRLVTIAGEGGIGKTRLALAVAWQLRQQFQHGVWFVPLAGLDADGDSKQVEEQLATAVTGAIGLPLSGAGEPNQQLIGYLRHKNLLLVLDNFEHLFATAPFITDLLKYAPQVRVLITSRVQLRVQAEVLFPLSGLSVPATADVPDIDTYGSIQLFMTLSQRLQTQLTLERDLAAIVQICQLVDGLPLGIELAASWTGHFACNEIARALQENLDSLTALPGDVPERQRSLRAAFDYSWQLLSAREQRLLAQLSIFRGGFSRQAAMQITGTALLDLVGLVSKFLLRATVPGRYEMHERICRFAAEKLAELAPQMATELDERHSAFYLSFVAEREEALTGRRIVQAVSEIGAELDNVRNAWNWAVRQGNLETVRRAAPGLSSYYDHAGLHREGEQIMGMGVNRLDQDRLRQKEAAGHKLVPGLPVTLAVLLAKQAHHLIIQAQFEEALVVARRAVPLAEKAGELAVVLDASLREADALSRMGYDQAVRPIIEKVITQARASNLTHLEAEGWHHWLSRVAMFQKEDDDRDVARLGEKSLNLYRRAGDWIGELRLLITLADSYQRHGYLSRAKVYCERGFQAAREMGIPRLIGIALLNLGGIHAFLGENLTARTQLERALDTAYEFHLQFIQAHVLDSLSRVYASLGEVGQALDANQQTLTALETTSDRREHVLALLFRGYLLLGQGELAKAVQAVCQAQTLTRESDMIEEAMKCRALLGRIWLARRHSRHALVQIEPVLDHLANEDLIDFFEAFEIHYHCYEILAANRDGRARDFLEMVHERLQTWAGRIDDESERRSFLENVPAHRQIVAAHEALQVGS